MAVGTRDESFLQPTRIVQVTLLEEDVLVAFSNGTSAVLDANDIRQLVLRSAKIIVTEQQA